MNDPRHEALAGLLTGYSCELTAGDKVLIEAIDVPSSFTRALIRAAAARGAHPLVLLKSQPVTRELLRQASVEQFDLTAAAEQVIMKGVQAYIGVRGSDNISELSDVSADKMRLYESRLWKPVHLDIRVPQTRWVVLRWPNASMAQLARRSTDAFEDFYFQVCTMDYASLSEAMRPLRELMERTDRVRLVAPGTDLTFSIREIPAVLCDGHRNIPDGEVYTAPVRDSVDGCIRYNTPSVYQGVVHEDVTLTFRQGRVVEASGSAQEHLEQVLGTDEGARYIGEFALGLNPFITEPMNDILFDEKIAGSIHFTPGNAYESADNGNRSQVHWDLVLMMDPAHGGGEVWFDDVLVRQDGLFVLPELTGLNPEVLTAT